MTRRNHESHESLRQFPPPPLKANVVALEHLAKNGLEEAEKEMEERLSSDA